MKKLLFVLIVLGLFLIACQTGPAGQEVSQEADTQDDVKVAPVPADDSDEPDVDVENDPDEGSEDGAAGELMEFFAKKGRLNYQVTYDLVADSAGTHTESELTMYMDLPEKMRTDVETQGIEARTYMEGEKFTSCSNNDGWTCFQMEHTTSVSDQIVEDVEENPADYSIRPLLPKTVAGAVTACFRITTEDATVDYCFSKEGVPLHIKTEGEHEGTTFSSEMTATSYSTSVPSSAFDLPAEPMDMGNLDDLIAQYS